MSLPADNKDAIIIAGSVALDEVFGQIRLKGFEVGNPSQPIGLLAEDDGTLRSQTVLWDGTAQIRWQAETPGGEAKMSLYGTEVGGSIFGIRINPRDELQVDSHGMPVHVDPTDLTTALDTTVHTVPIDALDTIEIEVNLHTSPDTDITIYVVESGGATGVNTQRWSGRLRDQDEPLRLGPWHLEAGGTIQVLAGTANRASVQPIIWRKTL